MPTKNTGATAQRIKCRLPEVARPARGLISSFVCAILLGAFVAWWRSFSLLDPLFLVLFLCTPVILVGPAIVAGHVGRSLAPAIARSYATIFGAFVVALGWINSQWPAEWLLPETAVLVAGLALGISLTTLAALAMRVALRHVTKRYALTAFRIVMFGSVLLYFYFPSAWSIRVTEFIVDYGIANISAAAAAIIAILDFAVWRGSMIKRVV